MDTIVIVCGAGASSTFLASRMRAIAAARNLSLSIEAASDADLVARLGHSAILLVGSHLAPTFDELQSQAGRFGVTAALLPSTALAPGGAGTALDVALSLLAARGTNHTTEGSTNG